jgi:hypothetical protein
VQQLLPQSMPQCSKGREGYVMLQCSNQDWTRGEPPDGFISVLQRSIMLQRSMDILNSCAGLNGCSPAPTHAGGHPPKPAFYTYAVVYPSYPGLFFTRSPSRKNIRGGFLAVHHVPGDMSFAPRVFLLVDFLIMFLFMFFIVFWWWWWYSFFRGCFNGLR